MAKRLLVTSSPHYRAPYDTKAIMLDVIVALMPASAASVFFFGWRSLFIILVTIATCIASETIFNLITKKKNTVNDLSAVVTGLLLALTLPVTVPYWMCAVGGAFAIIIVKMFFGGLGNNFLNPALASRCFLFSWASTMTTFIKPMSSYDMVIFGDPIIKDGATTEYIDSITTATPLSFLNTGDTPYESLFDMFLGNKAGCIGEISIALLLLGGIYLLARRVISWHIPVSYIGTVALITFLFPAGGGHFDVEFMLYEIMSGGLVLGAFFMATDYVTSPMTKGGKILFGIGCGAITVIIRYFGGYAEGVSFAILMMNIFAVALDKAFKPRRYGSRGMLQ